MLDLTQKYIESNSLFRKNSRLLLAVSGGIDSMVCLDVLHKLGYPISIAHCNFQLREKESDADEDLVKLVAENNNIPFHSKKFETNKYAEHSGISIQMAARDLRYEWFEELQNLYKYDFVIVAHHLDDSIETCLVNLSRGTGLKGLTGIQAASGKVRRPLLFATREDINHYAEQEGIDYREDSSNSKTNYIRNRIRLKVLTELREINPSLSKTFANTLEILNQEQKVLDILLTELKKDILDESDSDIRLKLLNITESPYRDWLLYHLLNDYGFNKQQINSINESIGEKVGLQFHSPSSILTIDREFAFISKQHSSSYSKILIQKDQTLLNEPICLEMSSFDFQPIDFDINPNIAFLDSNMLEFPLILDHWQEGDSFYPLGMNRNQKLSDFFVNSKIPRHQKDKIWILRSGGKIAWIIGHRIDHRYRVKKSTKKIFRLELKH
jgi:tRNA(Ile)-lysidine synthase